MKTFRSGLKIENLNSLVRLQKLDLKHNTINKLENLEGLSNLVLFDLYNNQISKIENLEPLTQLNNLYIYLNQIKKIENLSHLTKLKTLSLSKNQITRIENLEELHSLESLFLYENQISKIENLNSLTQLESIYLADNRITKIENLENLNNLIKLDLTNNQIRSVPIFLLEKSISIEKIDNKTDSGGLSLYGNPLEFPTMEILKHGREFALEYLKNQIKRPLNECKVIIIGRGSVGKTSLQKRIVNDNDFESTEEETHGIRKICWDNGIVSIEGEPIVVHFWDFGGQHIQQTLHQFFYSENTLYILVLDKRIDENPEDFLELIKVYSNNAPVIIVYNNKKNLKTKKQLYYEQEPELDSTLRNKYPNIKKVFGLCCGQKNDVGIKNLRIYLQKLIPCLDHVRETYPANWLKIENDLREEVTRNFISYESYEELCRKQNVDSSVIQKGLAKMLNDVGAITFFDRQFIGKYYILNPDWLTTGAYQIMLSQITKDKKGKINYADLNKIFSDKNLAFKYNLQEYEFLLSLMKEFNLCHEFGKNEWLIPSSLEGQSKTDLVEFKKGEHRLYRIEFPTSLPTSVIHRFIARNISFSFNNDYWKNGIVVKHPYSNTFIYVETDQKDKEIRLWIKGEQIRDCWEFFRKDFNEFSGKFQYTETVIIDNNKTKVSYQDLVDLLNAGEQEWSIPRYGKINIKETLGLFEKSPIQKEDKAELIENNIPYQSKLLKTFISYSKFDGEETNDGINYLEDFKTTLTPLTYYNKLLSTWDDTLLIAGENWNDRIISELKLADVIFVLVSNNLLKTKYIKNTELKIAFEREAKGECIVVPIIIRDCGWSDISWFAKNNAIPRKGHTISSWKKKFASKDQAWKHIYDEIKRMIESSRI